MKSLKQHLHESVAIFFWMIIVCPLIVGVLGASLLFSGIDIRPSFAAAHPQPTLRKVRLQTTKGVKDVRARVWDTPNGLVIELDPLPERK